MQPDNVLCFVCVLETGPSTLIGLCSVFKIRRRPSHPTVTFIYAGTYIYAGSQGGLVVINCASHLCDPSSTLASGRMWADFQSISI